jgi:hypothetical protein
MFTVYVNPFVCGILTTLAVEFLLMIAYVAYKTTHTTEDDYTYKDREGENKR